MSTIPEAEGHVHGNFHAYYRFNPAGERLRFMDAPTSAALKHAILRIKKDTEENERNVATVMDVGCNEGKSMQPANACAFSLAADV